MFEEPAQAEQPAAEQPAAAAEPRQEEAEEAAAAAAALPADPPEAAPAAAIADEQDSLEAAVAAALGLVAPAFRPPSPAAALPPGGASGACSAAPASPRARCSSAAHLSLELQLAEARGDLEAAGGCAHAAGTGGACPAPLSPGLGLLRSSSGASATKLSSPWRTSTSSFDTEAEASKRFSCEGARAGGQAQGRSGRSPPAAPPLVCLLGSPPKSSHARPAQCLPYAPSSSTRRRLRLHLPGTRDHPRVAQHPGPRRCRPGQRERLRGHAGGPAWVHRRRCGRGHDSAARAG